MYKGSLKGLYKGLEFPKIRGTLFWGPFNKDPSILGIILGSPICGNSHTCSPMRVNLRITVILR